MTELLKVLFSFLTPLIGFFTKFPFISPSRKKMQDFKMIKKEYDENKIIGYYYFQTYLKIRLSKEEMDFIFNSEDAYSILKIIKNCYGKYKFTKGKFKTEIKRKKYIIPTIFYFISTFILMFYILFYQEIINYINLTNYLFFLAFVVVICLPTSITSFQRVTEITDVLFLQEITLPRKGRRSNTVSNADKRDCARLQVK